MRWCTVGDGETAKCRAMKEEFATANLQKAISCYQAADHIECMQLINGKERNYCEASFVDCRHSDGCKMLDKNLHGGW